jgi:hypothetical protein
MAPTDRRPDINMSGIPVAGIGGLGLVAVAAVMTVVFPEAWWLVVFGALGGVVVGAAMILGRRHRPLSERRGGGPTLLFPDDVSRPAAHRGRSISPRGNSSELLAVR